MASGAAGSSSSSSFYLTVHSDLAERRSCGTRQTMAPTTAKVMAPPTRPPAQRPTAWRATPARTPQLVGRPMKIALTDETLPKTRAAPGPARAWRVSRRSHYLRATHEENASDSMKCATARSRTCHAEDRHDSERYVPPLKWAAVRYDERHHHRPRTWRCLQNAQPLRTDVQNAIGEDGRSAVAPPKNTANMSA